MSEKYSMCCVEQDMYKDSIEVCSGNDGWVQSKGGIASRLRFKPFLTALVMDRLADETSEDSA